MHAHRVALNTQSAREFPIGFIESWTVETVKSALSQFLRGDFNRVSQMVDAMCADDKIFDSLDARILSVVGLEVDMVSADNSGSKGEKIAAEAAGWWYDAVPEWVTRDMLKWAIMLRAAAAEMVWVAKGKGPAAKRWVPKVVTHHPQFLRFDETKQQFTLSTRDGLLPITPGDGRWLLWTPAGPRGWSMGAVRPLAVPWLIRTFVRSDWAKRAEFVGGGAIMAKVPKSEQKAEVINAFVQQLRRLGKNSVVKIPEGFDVVFDALGELQSEGFAKLAEHAEKAITLALRHVSLTTSMDGNGSNAAAKTHRAMGQGYDQAECDGLATFEREQVLGPWAEFNHGDRDLAPWPLRDAAPPEDTKASADTMKAFVEALRGFVALGVPVDVPALAERFGVPLDAARSELIRLFELTPEVVAALTKNELRERLGYESRPEFDEPAPTPKAPPPPPPAAPEDGETADENGDKPEDNSEANNARRVFTAARRAATGQAAGEAYVDALEQAGTTELADALVEDVDAVLDAIEGATSLEDARTRATKAHAKMNPAKGARVVRAARVLGELAGRMAVAQDAGLAKP